MSIPNNLWTKNGGAPRPLPASDRDATGLPWDNLANNAEGREACGYAKAPDYPDYDAATQQPAWVDGAWEIQALPATEAPPSPLRISKYEFTQLFTVPEYVEMLKLEQRAKAADLSNPANFMMGVVLMAFDIYRNGLTTYIELDAPATISLVNDVFVANSVLSPERAAQVLANQPPPSN